MDLTPVVKVGSVEKSTLTRPGTALWAQSTALVCVTSPALTVMGSTAA
jgi:hypothetical protein